VNRRKSLATSLLCALGADSPPVPLLIDEVERLTRLAWQLLTLAKDDATAVEPSLEDCSLGAVIWAAVTAAAPAESVLV
jgi:signal transduction histidine kinase